MAMVLATVSAAMMGMIALSSDSGEDERYVGGGSTDIVECGHGDHVYHGDVGGDGDGGDDGGDDDDGDGCDGVDDDDDYGDDGDDDDDDDDL